MRPRPAAPRARGRRERDDVLIGGNDTLLGGGGDDVLIGGPGIDTLDGGTGDNIVLDSFTANVVRSATAADEDWVSAHARRVAHKTVLHIGGKKHTLPHAGLARLARDARAS